MIKTILRILVLLWAVFFAVLAVRGLIDPSAWTAQFGVAASPTGDPGAMNTVRADFAAFFLVASGAAAWGAVRPQAARMLFIPAALFGIALIGRAIGVAAGDVFSPSVRLSMIAEAVSVLLMINAARILSRG